MYFRVFSAYAKELLPATFILGGLSPGGFSVLEKSYPADLLMPKVRGTGYGMLHALRGVGALISNIVVGFLWSHISPPIAFLYAALISFCAVGILLLL